MLRALISHGGAARWVAVGLGVVAPISFSATREARAEETRAAPSKPVEDRPKTSAEAQAGEGLRVSEVLLFRTAVVDKSDSKARASDAAALARAQQLDLVLTDAIQDLGFTLISPRGLRRRTRTHRSRGSRAGHQTEQLGRLSQHRRGGIGAGGADGGGAPRLKVASVRIETVKASELAVRAVVMLRDVIAARSGTSATELAPRRANRPEPPSNLAAPARSRGRSTLAFNGALFGGFVGYSVQRGTGSDNPRLLFPLMALGTGLGLGASAIVAEEWDVGLGDAWYMSAAAWWPALAGLLVARGRSEPDPPTEYSYAVVGALSGLSLATTSLALGGGMGEGGRCSPTREERSGPYWGA